MNNIPNKYCYISNDIRHSYIAFTGQLLGVYIGDLEKIALVQQTVLYISNFVCVLQAKFQWGIYRELCLML